MMPKPGCLGDAGMWLMASNPDARPEGEPLALTPEQLDQAAAVTPVDLMMARLLWEQSAPPVLRGLLDAAPEEPKA